MFNTPDNKEFLGIQADKEFGLEKATKGTPQYDKWLAEYRAKRGKKVEIEGPGRKKKSEEPESGSRQKALDILSNKREKKSTKHAPLNTIDKLEEYLSANPGWHSSDEIFAGLDDDTVSTLEAQFHYMSEDGYEQDGKGNWRAAEQNSEKHKPSDEFKNFEKERQAYLDTLSKIDINTLDDSTKDQVRFLTGKMSDEESKAYVESQRKKQSAANKQHWSEPLRKKENSSGK